MDKSIALSICLSSLLLFVEAQLIPIRGVVTDDRNEPLVGVTIQEKGTSNGTITDAKGTFELFVSASDATVVFDYLGFNSEEVEVGNRTEINVRLKEDIGLLDEVVVTAFGIEQNKRTLNYAVQSVGGEDLVTTQQQNLVNSLQGKLAGVQVTSSGGSPGSSSSIAIRGARSVSQGRSNEPLFVIDGIIMDNSTFEGGGNRAQDINPNDIESISVLKGPSAAALYGIGGGNGAIIITTKSGKSGKMQVTFGSVVALDRVFGAPEMQTTYGRGVNGIFDESTSLSWGPALTPDDEFYDNVGTFFQTAAQQKYDIGISGGNEKSNFYLSLSNNNQTGIVPKETYNRFNSLFKASTRLRENLKVSFNSSLALTDNMRMRGGRYSVSLGSVTKVFTWPSDDDMSQYLNENGTKNWLIDDLDPIYNNSENPYWRINNNLPEYDIRRTINQVFLEWDLIDDLKFTYRIGGDFSNQYVRSAIVPESAGSATNHSGRISESEKASKRLTSVFNLSYTKSFNDWNLYALAGHNLNTTTVRQIRYSGSGFLLPSLISINNVEQLDVPTQANIRKRQHGVYSEVRLDYGGIISLGLTGRNDWSSTLPVKNNSFFYPSISTGFVFTEFLQNRTLTDVLSYGKLRFTYAESAQDTNAEALSPFLERYEGIGGGYNYAYFAGNPNLVPEFFTSREIGMELKLFKGRLGLDITRYETGGRDLIIQDRISPASGWIILTFNAGNISNKGWEVVLDQKMIDKPDFKWNTNLVFSKNQTIITKLPSYISQLPVTEGQLLGEAIPAGHLDGPIYGISGSQYLRNRDGELVLDEDGYPRIGSYVYDDDGNYVLNSDGTRSVSQERVFLGDREPDWLLGITNTFNYKNFGLSFLFDIRKGGKIINATSSVQLSSGTHHLLDEWRNRSYRFEGVVETVEGFVASDQSVILDENYWRYKHRLVGENFIEDGSWIKLRYVALTYTPDKLAELLNMRDLSMSVTVRNPFLISKYSGGDPEKDFSGSAVGGAGTVGLDYFSVPNTQGITFGLNATF